MSDAPVKQPCQHEPIHAGRDRSQPLKQQVIIRCRKCGVILPKS